MTSIEVANVGVAFRVYSASSRSIKNQLFRTVGGTIREQGTSHVVVTALKNLTITLRPGDRLALIGGNGAGKSTLLKVLAGILEPSSGSVCISGRVSSLLDMSMGMDAEATGYENIIMRSVILGATFAEARKRVPEIEAFSELGAYLRLPLRTYSTGMSLRLSFAIATYSQPEILVLDEMIGTGDAGFAKKATARLNDIVSKLKILIIATHDLNTACAMCNRGIVLQHGSIVIDDEIGKAVAAYRALNRTAVSVE